MFEITTTLDDSALNSVTYHVHLRLFERDRFHGHDERVWRMRGIMPPRELPLIPAIEAIVAEIEADAGRPIEAMSDPELRVYTQRLDEISDARRPPSTPESIARAEQILEEIRREFGYAA